MDATTVGQSKGSAQDTGPDAQFHRQKDHHSPVQKILRKRSKSFLQGARAETPSADVDMAEARVATAPLTNNAGITPSLLDPVRLEDRCNPQSGALRSYFDRPLRLDVKRGRMNSCAIALITRSAVLMPNVPNTVPAPLLESG